MRRRKIAVVTTARADFGLLYWLIRAVENDRALCLQLIVTGMHLSRAFGLTGRAILAEGFKPAARVGMRITGGTDLGTARSIASGVAGMADALARLKPDVMVVLGDRFEVLASCAAAAALGVPIAHLHGGESTEGVIDEQLRHAVTKLAYLHFPAAEPYRRRIIQMGEDPRRVFNVGAPGLEYISRLEPVDVHGLERLVGVKLDEPFALTTFHPEGKSLETLDNLLSVLRSMDLKTIFTFSNADAGGLKINARLKSFCRRRQDRAAVVASLGQRAYLSLMGAAAAVAGNSSSGILEAPSLRVPTVNIGDRQAGRLRAPSVIDCPGTRPAIARALRLALSPSFRARRCRGHTPYGGGRVAERILTILKTFPLRHGNVRKAFYDLPGRSC